MFIAPAMTEIPTPLGVACLVQVYLCPETINMALPPECAAVGSLGYKHRTPTGVLFIGVLRL